MEHVCYKVVVNHEEQYALWMEDKENAAGWEDAGIAGTKFECLEYIRQVWIDMRPLSLRKAMGNTEMSGKVYEPTTLREAARHNQLAEYFE